MALAMGESATIELYDLGDVPGEKRTGPSIRRGKSNQVVQTPREFLDAVERRFGRIQWDLAANAQNQATTGEFLGNYFGPGSEHGEDALKIDWMKHPKTNGRSVWWLNPEFGDVEPWAATCARIRYRSGWTPMLVPSATSTDWWHRYVLEKAMIINLKPKIRFIGHKNDFPKDLSLVAYGFGLYGNIPWRWKENGRTEELFGRRR